MVNIISDYIPPFSPLPNIAPFTYKDGETYLSTLDRIRRYVNDKLVAFINENILYLAETFESEVNKLITVVNTQLGLQDEANDAKIVELVALVQGKVDEVNAALAAQQADYDGKIAAFTTEIDGKIVTIDGYIVTIDGKISDLTDFVNTSVTTINNLSADINTAISNHTDLMATTTSNINTILNDQTTSVDTKITNLETYVNNQVALIIGAEATLNDSVVDAIVNDIASATRISLDTLYSGGGGGSFSDEAMATIINDIASDTRAKLEQVLVPRDEFDSGVAFFVNDTESASRTALDALYTGGGLDDTGVAALVDTPASATRTSLDALYSGGGGGGVDGLAGLTVVACTIKHDGTNWSLFDMTDNVTSIRLGAGSGSIEIVLDFIPANRIMAVCDGRAIDATDNVYRAMFGEWYDGDDYDAIRFVSDTNSIDIDLSVNTTGLFSYFGIFSKTV